MRRHVVTALIIFACAVAGAGIAVRYVPAQYGATAQFVVTPVSTDNADLIGMPLAWDLGDPIRSVETTSQLLETAEIAGLAARRLGPPWTVRTMLNAVAVSPIGQTNVVAVTAHASSQAAAISLANTYSRAIVDERRTKLNFLIASAISAARQQLAQPANRTPSISAALAERIVSLQAIAATGDPTLSLVQHAVPDGHTGLPPQWVFVAAIVVGAIIAAAGALAMDRMQLREASAGPSAVGRGLPAEAAGYRSTESGPQHP